MINLRDFVMGLVTGVVFAAAVFVVAYIFMRFGVK